MQPVASRAARVVFESGSDHLAVYHSAFRSTAWATAGGFWAYAAQDDYQRICVAPCQAALMAGTDTYSVARVTDVEQAPISVGSITLPTGDSRVVLHYSSRSAARVVGAVVVVGSVAGLVYSTVKLVGIAQCPQGDSACENTALKTFAWSAGASLGAMFVGAALLSFGDVVTATVMPRHAALEPSLPRARQLTLRGSF